MGDRKLAAVVLKGCMQDLPGQLVRLREQVATADAAAADAGAYAQGRLCDGGGGGAAQVALAMETAARPGEVATLPGAPAAGDGRI